MAFSSATALFVGFFLLMSPLCKAQLEQQADPGSNNEVDLPPERLRLSPEQTTQNQPAGESFALFCNKGLGDGTYTNFEWIGPQGQVITQNASALAFVFKSENGLALNFDKPTPETSGRYTCRALYGGTSTLEVTVKISFFHDITFDDCAIKQDLVLGRDGTVRCEVHGNPVPTVRWNKQQSGGPLPADRFTVAGSSLNVRHVENDDAGRYQVTAMVEATGKIKRQYITVSVITPPTIDELNNVSYVTEGEPGAVTCSAGGIPQPLCYWTDFKNRNLSDVEGFRVTPDSCRLEFIRSSRQLEGLYTCHAVNPAGKDTRETRVEVIVPPKVLDFENKTVDEGGEALLECRAEGKPLPELQIRKEGVALPLGYEDDFVAIEHDSGPYETTLRATIRPVRRAHAGLYYCSAENRLQRVVRTGMLDVNYAPVLVAKQNPVYTWANRPATLTCHIQAIPNATVEWRDTDGNLLRDPTLYTIDNTDGLSVFTVSNEADRYDRDFVCIAVNSLGESSVKFRVLQARRPDAPSLPKVHRVTATTVMFEFNRLVNDGGMPVLEFLIRYWRDDQRPDEAESKAFSEMIGKPLTIGRLTPRTRYTFTFSARSEVGEGPRSALLTINTTGEAVPDRPTFINPPHADAHPSRVHIEWTMPLDNGKPIDMFSVSYQPVEMVSADEYRGSGRKRTISVTSWSSMVSTDLLDLWPEVFYRVQVEAHNALGYGPPAVLIFRTGTAPGIIGPYPDGDETATSGPNRSIISTPVIVALIVLLVFIVLILVDVICYFRFRKGLLYALRYFVCSKPKHVYSKTGQSPAA